MTRKGGKVRDWGVEEEERGGKKRGREKEREGEREGKTGRRMEWSQRAEAFSPNVIN